jgi:hypothetical protein
MHSNGKKIKIIQMTRPLQQQGWTQNRTPPSQPTTKDESGCGKLSPALEDDLPVNDEGEGLADAPVHENPGADYNAGPRERGRLRTVTAPPIKETARSPSGGSPEPYNLRRQEQPTDDDVPIRRSG